MNRTQELNAWIKAQNNPGDGLTVVDLWSEMLDHQKYGRADFVHPNSKGSKAMGSYITSNGGIADNAA